MVEFMQLLAEQRPDLVTLLNVSKTFEGRPMYGVKVSSYNSLRKVAFSNLCWLCSRFPRRIDLSQQYSSMPEYTRANGLPQLPPCI